MLNPQQHQKETELLRKMVEAESIEEKFRIQSDLIMLINDERMSLMRELYSLQKKLFASPSGLFYEADRPN